MVYDFGGGRTPISRTGDSPTETLWFKWQKAELGVTRSAFALQSQSKRLGLQAHGGAKTKTQDRGANYALFAAAAAEAAWAACANLLTNFSLIRADLPLRLRK